MKEQSHKDEMSAAIRGDFQRLRDRGVAATLAPHDDDPLDTAREEQVDVSAGPPGAQEILSEHSEAVVVFEPEPEVMVVSATPAESAPEPPADAGDERRDAEQPGFLARLLGR